MSNELTITKEELDAKSRESADLNARLKAVDEQIENTEKLIQVNSEEMRKPELAIEKNKQNAVASTPGSTETNPATAEVPAAISADGKVVAPTDPASATALPKAAKPRARQRLWRAAVPSPETPKAEGPQETPPAQEPKPAAVAQPSPAKTNPQAEPSGVVDLLKNNLLYIGGGLCGAAGLVLVLLKRRRGEEEDPAPGLVPLTMQVTLGGGFSLPPLMRPSLLRLSRPRWMTQRPFNSRPRQTALSRTDDVVSESDIHIALSDFDLRPKTLLSSLEQDPPTAACC